MINIPLPKIKEKILENNSMTEEELDKKISEKLEQLSGLISEEGAAHIIANEMGITLFQSSGKLDIKNILAEMRDVEAAGKVTRKFETREFNTGTRSGKVANMIMADTTGTIKIVMWNDQADNADKIKEGDIIQVQSAYVRENQGRLEIHMNDNSRLTINPTGVKIDVEVGEYQKRQRKKLSELTETDDNVEVLATIVQAFEPKFFEVCPECGKRTRDEGEGFKCQTHGNIKSPDYGYVMNLFLDDGTDNVRSVLWRNQVQNLLGMKDNEIIKFKDSPAEFEKIKNDLLGNIVKVAGRVQKNQAFDRLEFVAAFVDRNPNPEEEIKKLNEEADKVLEEEKEKTADESFTTASEVKEEKTEKKEKEVKEEKTEVTEKAAEKEETKESKAEVKVETNIKTEVTEETDDFDMDDDLPSIDDL